MKSLSPLFFAGLCSATFSGCYMDRNPTMTLEDKMFADEKPAVAKPADKEKSTPTPKVVGVQKRKPTFDEYLAATGRANEVTTYDFPVRSNTDYRVFVFVKSRDHKTGAAKVSLMWRGTLNQDGKRASLLMYKTDADTKFTLLLDGHGSQGFSAYQTDYGIMAAETESRLSTSEHETTRSRAPLLVPGIEQRFVVREIDFLNGPREWAKDGVDRTARSRFENENLVEFEMECVVVCLESGADSAKVQADLNAALEVEWSAQPPTKKY